IVHGQRFQGLTNLSHHPLTSCAADFSFQRLSLLWFDDRWKLNEPGGSAFRQVIKDRTVLSITNQLTERFEHRVVSFFPAKTFDTLPASYPQIFATGRPLMKNVHERRFTDNRLTGYKDHLPLSVQCFGKVPLEFGYRCFTADNICCPSNNIFRWRGTSFITYLRYELIAAPRNSLNVYGLLRAIT